MKSNAKSSLYFSAYPLKAIKEPTPASGTESPYLRSVLSGSSNIKTSRVRVFPMVNPYPQTAAVAKTNNSSTGTGSPYLRAVLAGTGSIKTNSRVQLSPTARLFYHRSLLQSPWHESLQAKQSQRQQGK
jgi:hypothetical protein